MPSPSALTSKNERILMILLTCVNFTHIMDYMIIMPLGARLMETLRISPAQFSSLVAAYSLAAAVSGFLGGFLLDRFERKQVLLSLYLGFSLATLACGLVSSYSLLLLLRLAAGACGGVAGSVVYAIVSDVVPSERRGKAMGLVMSAFPLASILGVPAGLWLTSRSGWQAPFLMLGLLSLTVLVLCLKTLPRLPHVPRSAEAPWQQMMAILRHPLHQNCFALSGALVFAGGCVIPFMAPSMVTNQGLTESQLTWIYLLGGAATLLSTNLIGAWSDRSNKVLVLVWISLVCSASILLITQLSDVSLGLILLTTTFFFMSMAGRFPPTMALITNAISPSVRGGFMSVNSAVQQVGNSLASLCAGLFLSRATTGRLEGYPQAGLLAVASLGLSVLLAYRVGRMAPAAAKGHAPALPSELCE